MSTPDGMGDGTGDGPGNVPAPNNGGEFDPEGFGRYYRPRAVRPVNAVPMGNGYYIQQQGAQVPMQRVQQVPVRPVQQIANQGLQTFYLD